MVYDETSAIIVGSENSMEKVLYKNQHLLYSFWVVKFYFGRYNSSDSDHSP